MHCRLRVLMAEQDPPLTQTDLVQRLKLGSHTVSKLYNSTFRRVDAETVEKLCDFFECGIQELFELRDSAAR